MNNSFQANPLFFRSLQISRSVLIFGFLVVWLIGYAFYIEQILRPAVYDSVQYWDIAREYNTQGIINAKQEVRTFIYPWVLSLILKVSNIINVPNSFFLFVIQNFIYLLCILCVSNVIFKYSKYCATMLYILLCANIFLLPYIGISLSDALCTCFCMILFAWMMELESADRSMSHFAMKWVLIGIGVMSFLIAMRPAAVWLILPTFYCLLRAVYYKKIKILDLLVGTMLGAIPLYIQIAINVTNYKVISFLPIIDLGSSQIKWGIENIKVSAWLGGGGSPLNFYPSGDLITIPSEFNLFWYLKHPIDAIKLLSFKLVGAFDFNFLVPYPYSLPKFKWLPSLISLSILWGGLYASILHLCTNRLVILGSRFLPILIFVGWCSVSLISALELRFSLPILSYFIIVSCVLIYFITTEKSKKFLLSFMIGWMIFMPIVIYMAHYVRLQSAYQG